MARRRAAVPTLARSDHPPELRSRLDPIWRDESALRARFGEYLSASEFRAMRLGRSLHNTVLTRWALANGFESTRYAGSADWHQLRAVGVIT